MLKRMAQDNMQEFDQDPKVAMDVIKTTYEFMKKNGLLEFPATDGNLTRRHGGGVAPSIAKFLACKVPRIEDILANLRATGEIEYDGKGGGPQEVSVPIEKEILEFLPTLRAARVFRQVVQATKTSHSVQMITPPPLSPSLMIP